MLKKDSFSSYGVPFDVRDEKMIDQNVSFIEKEIGKIDILINNAGIQIRAPLEEFHTSDWRHLIDINLTSAFLV